MSQRVGGQTGVRSMACPFGQGGVSSSAIGLLLAWLIPCPMARAGKPQGPQSGIQRGER
jgi:hypothetical protein